MIFLIRLNIKCYLPLFFLLSSKLFSQTLNEVMFNPLENNSEYIEIYNYGNSEISLQGYKIKYQTSTADSLVSIENNYTLLPGQYGVILEKDYDINNGIYYNLIPDDCKVFIIDDNAFGSSGMSNSSDRSIVLLNENDDTVDVYTYTADNPKGYSDERLEFTITEWQNSKILNGTPGFTNSVSPLLYDLSIQKFEANKNYFVIGDSISFEIEIKNLGKRENSNSTLLIFHENYLINTEYLPQLAHNEVTKIKYSYKDLNLGKSKFIAEIIFPQDEDSSNNSATLEFEVKEKPDFSKGDIVINEFMSSPKTPEPEWIEILNISDNIINLLEFKIADNKDTVKLTGADYYLEPNSFLVIADDSSFIQIYPQVENYIITNIPTLNNAEDEIRLLDNFNRMLDSLRYTQSWVISNQSVEKINPYLPSTDETNWESTEINTPGRVNSVAQKEFDVRIDSMFYSNPAIIDSQIMISVLVNNIGKNDFRFELELSKKNNNGKTLIEKSSEIFLNKNEQLVHHFTEPVTLSSDSITFFVEIITKDDDTTNNSSQITVYPSIPKNSLVLSEIMYSPINGEPEWFEIYNLSNYTIDLKYWSIEDILTNPISKIIHEDKKLDPHEYLVISKDSSIIYYHDYMIENLLVLQFANLNNNEDGIVIKDRNGYTIDSVKYSSLWGGKSGKSLERVENEHYSNDEKNWRESIDLEGSTPGRINSIAKKDYDLAISSLSIDPKYPVKGESVNLIIEIKNFGENEIKNFGINIYKDDENLSNLYETIEGLSIDGKDSLTITNQKQLLVNDKIEIKVNVVSDLDDDKINNKSSITIIPGFNKNTVLINEVMINPETNYKQWIEVVNNSDSSINLKNWQIGDGREYSTLSLDYYFISSGEYVVIYDGEFNEAKGAPENLLEVDLPEFNTSKDVIILKDFRNAVIDSIYYNFEIILKANSLERISVENSSTNYLNWIYSIDESGNTMGETNSPNNSSESIFGDVIVSEVLFNPNEGNSEFIEILNHSEDEINLAAWKILYKDNYYTIKHSSFNLHPNHYFTIAVDSSISKSYPWLTNETDFTLLKAQSNLLNNDGEIYLLDLFGNIIDSVHYNEKWHNPSLINTKNISLELINTNAERNNENNWSSSVSVYGATPSKENSINIQNISSQNKLEVSPNPFSPDNDGHEDFTTISYNLNKPISEVRVKIFDSKGRLVRDLVKHRNTGSKGSLIFDGRRNDGKYLKVGIYIVLFEAVSEGNSNIETIKDVVVIGKNFE